MNKIKEYCKKILKSFKVKCKTYIENNKETVRAKSEKQINIALYNYIACKFAIRLGYLDMAEDFINRAIALKQKDYYYYTLGSILKKKKKWRFSYEAFIRAEELGYTKKNKKFYKYHAEVLGGLEWHKEALEYWEKYKNIKEKKLSKKELFSILLQFEKIEENEQTEEIENFYKRKDKYIKSALKLLPDDYDLGIGLLFEEQGYHHIANKKYLEKINGYDYDYQVDPHLFYKIGLTYQRLFDFDNAVFYMEKAYEYKKDWYYLYKTGECYENLEKYKEAEILYQKALDVKKQLHYNTTYRLAYVQGKSGNYKTSCESFITLYEYNKENNNNIKDLNNCKKNHWFKLGLINIDNENYEKAEEYFEKANLSIYNFQKSKYYYYGYSLYKLGKYEEAYYQFSQQKIMQRNYNDISEKSIYNGSRKARVMKYVEYSESLKIENNYILYEWHFGKSFRGNPYAIFKAMISNPKYKGYKHFIAMVNPSNVDDEIKNNKDVYIIKYNSDLYLRLLAVSKYIVTNVTLQFFFTRREEQIYVNTWHGTPIKTIGKDVKKLGYYDARNITRTFIHSNLIINPNKYTEDVLIDSCSLKSKEKNNFKITGYPRQDLMLNITEYKKAKIKRELGIFDNKKIILYAPTWREASEKNDGGTSKFKELLQELVKIKNVHIVYRGHVLSEDVESDNRYKISINEDANELLSIVDVLITDYSSICIDYLAMDKPIAFYAFDEKEYKDYRGMYFDLNEINDNVFAEANQVVDFIKSQIKNETISDKQKASRNKFCYLDDGNASERVIESMLNYDFYNNSELLDKREKILFYPGALMRNGITSSAINLLNNIDLNKYFVTILLNSDHLINNPENYYRLKELPEEFQYISVYNESIETLQDEYINNFFGKNGNLYSNRAWETFAKLNNRSYKNMVGELMFDHVIDFEGYNHRIVRSLAYSDNIKSKTIFLHNDMLNEKISRFGHLEKIFRIYNQYDNIISVSEFLSDLNKNNLAEKYKINKEKFDFCNNTIKYKEIIEMSKEVIPDEDKKCFDFDKVFINIGRLSPEKDQEMLIRAFKNIVDKNKDKKLSLIILGAGPLGVHLNNLVAELGLKNNVFLLGLRDNPFSYLGQSDCFAFTSRYEGQPMVLLEAATLNKQIISVNSPTVEPAAKAIGAEVIERDLDSVANSMNEFVNGNIKYNGHFNPEKYIEEVMNKFYRILEK